MISILRKKAKSFLLRVIVFIPLLSSLLYSHAVLANDTNLSLGGIANTMVNSFTSVAKLIVAMCYIAGIGFAAAGILKFKQHKDNPTQITLGAPIALIFIAAALIWLPGIIQSTGGTIFGDNAESEHGSAAGRDIFDDTSSDMPG